MVRIYLAIQVIADGRLQIRRYSPDIEQIQPVFEKRSLRAKDWLLKAGNPKWVNRFEYPKNIEPYEIT